MSQPQENFHRPDCLKDASTVFVPKGTRVFQTGDACDRFFYLLAGSIRVDLIARNGRTIMLYRFGGGETCVLTTSCLLGGDAYCAEAVAEEDTWACVLPADTFEMKLSRSADFRRIVFSSFSARHSHHPRKTCRRSRHGPRSDQPQAGRMGKTGLYRARARHVPHTGHRAAGTSGKPW